MKINEYLIRIIFEKCMNTQDFNLGKDRNSSGGIG